MPDITMCKNDKCIDEDLMVAYYEMLIIKKVVCFSRKKEKK